jgi:pantetheine-phosphate adenylyltransferase
MKKAIYSGTFDPFTLGHLDIITKASLVFDEIIIAVAISKSKKPMFDIDTRVQIAKTTVEAINNIKVESFENLLCDFAKEKNINNIIRGVRTNIDFEYELQMSYANSSINQNLNTILFISDLDKSFISSSLVRELVKFGADTSHLLSSQVVKKGLIKKSY